MRPLHLAATLAIIEGLDCNPGLDMDWLRHRTLDDPTCFPDLLLVAEVGDEIVGFCFGCVRGERGVIKFFGVSKRHRRTGIATTLLNEIEARLGARGVSKIIVGGVAPNVFVPGVPILETAAIALLMQRGYTSNRVARVDMAVDLQRANLDSAASEQRLAGQGIVLGRAFLEEVDAASEFARVAFSENWGVEVSETARFDPLPLFIALDGDRVVGFAASETTGRSRFGPTGTDPDYRRRGIGGALLKMCLRGIRDRGESLATIEWVGPIGFYARAVGARVSKGFWVFEKSMEEDVPSTQG